MQNVMHIATNSGHDGLTMQNDGRTMCNVSQGPKGGLDPPPTPLLEKTLVSRNDF